MNTLAAFRSLLLSISAVTSLVSSRVYGVRVPGAKELFPCVLLRRVGGGSASANDEEAPLHNVTIDVRCYGADQPAAQSVASAISGAVNSIGPVVAGGYRFTRIIELIGPQDVLDEITEGESWDAVFMSYRVTVEAVS